VLTRDGEAVHADLVVDAGGRKSPMIKLLTDIGAPRPVEQRQEDGFRYYSRRFRPTDGVLPAPPTWPLDHHDSLSTLHVPEDNGHWSIALVVSGRDQEMRALRDEAAWHRVAALYPGVADWATAGEPITPVMAISGVESHHRRFVVDGLPAASGLVTVGDAWAASNPTFGLGLSLSVLHAALLRDVLRTVGTDAPEKLALSLDEAAETQLAPVHQGVDEWSLHRLAQIDGEMAGTRYETDDEAWNFRQALEAAKLMDPEVLRAMADVGSLLASPDEALAAPGLAEKILRLGAGAPRYPEAGPSRAELLSAMGAV
jgi:2-polyprenyl-6-methoxyphenol hydroxylase-like FAD-dependent oxidoreductase